MSLIMVMVGMWAMANPIPAIGIILVGGYGFYRIAKM